MLRFLFVALLSLPLVALAQKSSDAPIVQHITPEQMQQMIANKPGVVLDVRTPQETAEGMIDGAIQKDLFDDDFGETINRFDRNVPVYLYCASGGRSSDAADVFIESGFNSVYNMTGGIYKWEDQNLPIVIPEK